MRLTLSIAIYLTKLYYLPLVLPLSLKDEEVEAIGDLKLSFPKEQMTVVDRSSSYSYNVHK